MGYYRHITKLQKCDIFGHVCLSFCSHGGTLYRSPPPICRSPSLVPPLFPALALACSNLLKLELIVQGPQPTHKTCLNLFNLDPTVQGPYKLVQIGTHHTGTPRHVQSFSLWSMNCQQVDSLTEIMSFCLHQFLCSVIGINFSQVIYDILWYMCYWHGTPFSEHLLYL